MAQNKPRIKFKRGQWWIFSSRKASLDCMPQYKFKYLYAATQAVNIINKKGG